jgi:hypothetical protein
MGQLEMIASPFRFVGLLAAVLMAFALPAHADRVDWKFYGGADLTMIGRVTCFYEERTITRPKPGIVDVWVKCLSQHDLENVPTTAPYHDAYISMSADRMVHFYRPPILAIERMNYDQTTEVVMDETAADVGDLAIHAQFYYELDCRQRMMRELSMTIENQPAHTPSDWSHIPPEGNAGRLLLLLCR